MLSDRRAILLLGLMAALTAPLRVGAQTVEGRVVHGETGEPVPGAQLVLRSEYGAAENRAESDAEGRFLLASRSPGPHLLDVSRLGFADIASEPLELGQELVQVEIRLFPSPIELAPILVTARRRDVRHDATFEGALARHRVLPRVGGSRVVFRSDVEFRSTMVAADILQWFPPGRGCTVVFSNGIMARTPEAANMWLQEVPTESMEALEFYRVWADAPGDLKDFPSYIERPDPLRCSVVALWPRVDPPDRPAWTLGRVLRVGAVLGTVVLLGTLLAR
jgi:hypothetical protein